MRNSSKLGNDPVSQIWLVLLFVHFHQWIKSRIEVASGKAVSIGGRWGDLGIATFY